MTNSMDAPQSSQFALFLIHRFIVGGVETLMVRLAKYLQSQGWRVAIVTASVAPDAAHLAPPGIAICDLKGEFAKLDSYGSAAGVIRAAGFPHVDLIFTGDPWSCRVGAILSTCLPERPKMLCGVYQPDEYFYPAKRGFFRSSFGEYLRSKNFDLNIPDSSKVFTCPWIRTTHERSFARPMDSAAILLLPVDAQMFRNCARRPDRWKIVSIGRLTHWKKYNLYMIPIIQSLVIKGYPVHWEVFGDGEAKADMQRLAHEHGIAERVKFRGTVPYSQLSTVLEDAGIFVGMGTSMLEAAFCRVPTVPAIARIDEPLTYGCLHEMELGCTGDLVEGTPTMLVESVIERILQMTDDAYQNEMQKTWDYVQPYELRNVCAGFLNIIDNAKPGRIPHWETWAYQLHSRYLRWRTQRACR